MVSWILATIVLSALSFVFVSHVLESQFSKLAHLLRSGSTQSFVPYIQSVRMTGQKNLTVRHSYSRKLCQPAIIIIFEMVKLSGFPPSWVQTTSAHLPNVGPLFAHIWRVIVIVGTPRRLYRIYRLRGFSHIWGCTKYIWRHLGLRKLEDLLSKWTLMAEAPSSSICNSTSAWTKDFLRLLSGSFPVIF